MITCSPITRKTILAAVVLSLLPCGAAMAQERKIYKHVDQKSSVVYSEVPPMSGSSVKKLDMQPAYSGHGGYGISIWHYDNPPSYAYDYARDQYRNALQQRQRQAEDASNRRFAELEAECNRNRGTDCSDPEVLRYIESTKIPRTYAPYRQPNRR